MSPLQPGPFLQGSQADVAIAPGNYDFTDDAIGLAGQLAQISADWDAFMVDLPILAAGPADPTLGIDDAAILNAIANQEAIASFPSLDAIVAAVDTTDTLLGIAIAFAPAAAWTNPTTAFVPPDPNATILAPTVPIGDYTPNITGIVSGAPSPTLPSITLQNITRVGSLNFVVGDTFLLTVAANPGQVVSGDGIQNGVDLGTAVFGTTMADGTFSLSGVEGPEEVGSWLQNWYLDGQLVQTFSFIVSPGN
jgi:hypothetical protein